MYDVEELPTHGGSLRVYAQHADGTHPSPTRSRSCSRVRSARGLRTPEPYERFADDVQRVEARAARPADRSAARRASTSPATARPGKGNTLLNFCGIRTDLVEYTVDRNPYKQGKYTPGTRIPIHAPERLAETRPDYILVLPWNLVDEIPSQLDVRRPNGARS